MSGEELTAELQRVLKGLLAQGARLPKPLMLFVKGMLFFDHAIATMAPDVDLFQEMTRIYGYFAAHHADQIQREIGFDPRAVQPDLRGVRASLGLEEGVETLTAREMLERREVIRERLEKAAAGSK